MKTRRNLLFILIIAIAAVLCVIFRHSTVHELRPVEENPTNNTPESEISHPGTSQTNSTESIDTKMSASRSMENGSEEQIQQRRDQMENALQAGLSEWRTPIEFYGKVIDENSNPVPGASVHFVWTDLSDKGNSEKDTMSDGNGFFSLSNTNGKNLIVRATKEGYYSYQPFGVAFNYAGENQNFVPDAANPVVFRLKKMGTAEPLAVFEKTFQLSVSGKPLEISLKTGLPAAPGEGDLVAEFFKQSPQNSADHVYDWTLKITTPNGGLALFTNELDFFAPVSGYTPSDLIEMKTSLGNQWQSQIKRRYFVQLSGGKYARISLDFMSHNGSLQIQGFNNPSGSRNLEFNPQLTISP
jgi:hypothetical protein